MADEEISIPDSPEREFTITRIFHAPRELVWRAWTDPEQFAGWFGPRGYTVHLSSIALDLRPDGACEFVMVSDEDGTESVNHGVFVEVVEPERLSFRALDAELFVTVTLTDLGDGRTTLAIRVQGETYGEPAIAGWASMLDKLAEALTHSP